MSFGSRTGGIPGSPPCTGAVAAAATLVSAAAAVLLVSEQPERLRRKRIEREQVKILRILGFVRVTTITLHCTFPRAICKTFFAAILFLLAPAAQAESLDGFEA